MLHLPHRRPVILGDGMRLLDTDLEVDTREGIELTPIRVVTTTEVTHVRYRVNGRAALAQDYRVTVAPPSA